MITLPGTIPIRIYPTFWLLMILIGWINSFSMLGTGLWMLVIFISVVIHEYGHALTALAFGQTAEIELVALGGVTHRHGRQLKLWKEFLVVFNGPLAGALLACVAYWFYARLGKNPPNTAWTYIIEITLYANIFWTIVNLLPIHPLDGGRLLSIMMEALFGMRGIRISLLISGVFSLLIGLAAFAYHILIAGALFLMFAFESYRAWQSSLVMSREDRDEDLRTLLQQAEQDLHLGKKEAAQEKLMKVRESSGEGLLFTSATEYLASLLMTEGKFQEAYELLEPHKSHLSQNGLKILHELAFQMGAWKEAATLGDQVYMDFPSYDTAFINAASYALLGEVTPAIGWLQRSISDGLPNIRNVFQRKEFDSIRNSRPFQQLQEQYSRS